MRKQHAKLNNRATPDNVAKNAKPRHKKPTKAERNLAARIADYDKMDFGKIPPGTFHKPGSLQR